MSVWTREKLDAVGGAGEMQVAAGPLRTRVELNVPVAVRRTGSAPNAS